MIFIYFIILEYMYGLYISTKKKYIKLRNMYINQRGGALAPGSIVHVRVLANTSRRDRDVLSVDWDISDVNVVYRDESSFLTLEEVSRHEKQKHFKTTDQDYPGLYCILKGVVTAVDTDSDGKSIRVKWDNGYPPPEVFKIDGDNRSWSNQEIVNGTRAIDTTSTKRVDSIDVNRESAMPGEHDDDIEDELERVRRDNKGKMSDEVKRILSYEEDSGFDTDEEATPPRETGPPKDTRATAPSKPPSLTNTREMRATPASRSVRAEYTDVGSDVAVFGMAMGDGSIKVKGNRIKYDPESMIKTNRGFALIKGTISKSFEGKFFVTVGGKNIMFKRREFIAGNEVK